MTFCRYEKLNCMAKATPFVCWKDLVTVMNSWSNKNPYTINLEYTRPTKQNEKHPTQTAGMKKKTDNALQSIITHAITTK